MFKLITISIFFLSISAFSGISYAGDKAHQVVIQVSTNDPVSHKLVLNNAANIQQTLGIDNVDIKIVAYGPGLSILKKTSKHAARIDSMLLSGIEFDACNNTIQAIKRKTGKAPQLVDDITIVPAGAVRIMELQAENYSYLRP